MNFILYLFQITIINQMIRPLFCGMEECAPVIRKGSHGFMKSIEKDLPKDFDQHPTNVLKQKISLKHIANRHSKILAPDHIKILQNHCQMTQHVKKVTPTQTNKFQCSDQQRPGANNAISQYGQLQQNRRNLICLKNNLNHQIQRQKNHLQQGERVHNVSQIITKKLEVPHFRHTSGQGFTNIFYQNSKNTINAIKNQQFQPVTVPLENPKINQFHLHPFNENLQKVMSIDRHDEQFKNWKGPINQVLKQSIPINPQENSLAAYKSFKMIGKTQIVPSVINFQQRNLQNQYNLGKQKLQQNNLIGSAGKIIVSHAKEIHYVPSKKQQREKEKDRNSEVVNIRILDQNQNSPQDQTNQNSQQVYPFNEIALFLQINSNKRLILDPSKIHNEETLTRQNSKISIIPGENPKNSMLTTMTNESHFSEYQNHKQFEKRFNNGSRLLNTNNFGVHSYLEQIHTNQASRFEQVPNSEKQINKNEQFVEDEAQKFEEQEMRKYEQMIKEKRQNKNMGRNLRKRTSLELRQINLRNETKDCGKNELSIDCQQFNQESMNTSKNSKKKQNSKIKCHKKNRSSFFQAIQKQKNANNPTKTKTSNFTNTAKSGSKGSEMKQLSLFNMKDAQSFVESEEGSSSDQDSELEFVVHSCSNVKLKNFAHLKSMHGVKYDCNSMGQRK